MSDGKFYGIRVTLVLGRFESREEAEATLEKFEAKLVEGIGIVRKPTLLECAVEECAFTDALRKNHSIREAVMKPRPPSDPNLN